VGNLKVDETLFQRAMAAAAKRKKKEHLTLKEMLDLRDYQKSQGPWVPASGGKEEPFVTRSGYHLQYVYQPSTGKHAYLNLQTDLILDDEEAQRILGK
jgi:hypothetical protein